MTDIISTGIAIDSSSAVKAKQDMENLASVGSKVDSALAKVEQSSSRSGKSLATLSSYAKEITTSSTQLASQTQQLNATQSRQEVLLKQIGSSFSTLAREIKESTAAAQAQSAVLDRNRAGLSGMQVAAVGFGAAVATAFAAKQVYDFADALYKASASAQNIKTTLDFATGNGAKDFAYVTRLANQMGLQFTDTAKAFASFSAASKGTSLEGDTARRVFEAVSKAAAVMGLSSDQASGALLALQQMVSKGTVQSEELRGQLGERLPGAFQIAAKAMGVTTAELGKMLERGEVVASDFLPKFATALDAYVGGASEKAANRLDASTNRMGNSLDHLKRSAGDSGVSSFMSQEIEKAAGDFEGIARAMDQARESGSGFWGQIGAGVGAVIDLTGSTSRLNVNMVDNARVTKEAEARLAALQKRAREGIDVSVQMARLEDFIASLKEAKRIADAVGNAAGNGDSKDARIAMVNAAEVRRKEAEDERKAYFNDNARQTKAQIREEEYAKARTKNATLVARAEGDTNAILKLQAALKVELANIDDKYKDKKPRDTSARDGKAQLALDLEDIRTAQEGLTNTLKNGESVLDAQRSANLVTEAEYWDKKRQFLVENDRVQQDALAKEIERMRQSTFSGADKTNNDRKILEAEGKLDRMRATGAANLTVLNTQATASLTQVTAKYDQARAAAQSYVDTLTRQNARDIAGMGMGDQNREVNGRRNQREDQFQGRREQLDSQLRANQITKDEFEKYLQIEASAHERALAADEIYWAQKLTKQADWSVGASEAVTNYFNSARNVAAQAEQAWTNGFKSMEDALVSFATTGKADFKSMANSIIADMVRIQVRASITAAIGGGGGLSSLIGSVAGGLSNTNATNVANVIGGTDKLGSLISLTGGFGKYANGGVLSSPGLSAYSSQIVDKPTIFPFAKGIGLMGEAGEEAIMPLRRGADGKLGVAAGGGGGGDVIIHNYAGANVEAKRTPDGKGGFNLEVLIREVGEHVENRIADNIGAGAGPATRALEGRYGLRTAVS